MKASKFIKTFIAGAFVLATIATTQLAAAGELRTWSYDAAHSSVTWKVSHLMVSQTKGWFDKVDGSLQWNGENAEGMEVSVEFDIASINSKNDDRDDHLRGEDFFNANKYPKMTFKSTKIEKKGEDKYVVTGDLTIKDVTKPITFEATARGPVTSPWGFEAAGFAAQLTIDRRDWGITWNKTMDKGGLVVGNDVNIDIDVEMHHKPGKKEEKEKE